MRAFLLDWLFFNEHQTINFGRFAPWVFGLLIGRMPHKVEVIDE